MKKALFMILFWMLAGVSSAQASDAPVSNWVETGRVEFNGTDAFFRSQGVASDGASLFFSWNLGLSRTEIDDTSVVLADNTTAAIPEDLSMSNHNHIGDIDVSGGIIYAPIEDGPAYAEPWVVLYDAETLQPTGDRYLLPVSVQRDGVPWIAVDQPRGVAYSMEWNDTGKLFVYRLSDFELIRTVTLSEAVPRIQGAKVFRGDLYASRDNGAEKSVVAIDPERGQVTHLFDRDLGDDYEAEGIAFVRRPTGTLMLATGIREGAHGYTEMRTYRINGDETPPSLSGAGFKVKKIRPGVKPVLKLKASESVTLALRWSRCVGPKRKPCARTKAMGAVRTLSIPAGPAARPIPPNYPRNGKSPVRLAPGAWKLTVVPTDAADIVGSARTVGLTVLKPRR